MNHPFAIKVCSWLLPFFLLAGLVAFPARMGALIASSVWIIFMLYKSLVYRGKAYEEITEVITTLSFVWLILLVESLAIRWLLVGMSLVVFFFLIWMSSEYTGRLVHIKEKPLRRMRMMIQVFNMYAWTSMIFAVDVYFPSVPVVVLIAVSGVYAAGISFLILRLYLKYSITRFMLPLSTIALVVIQLMWVLRLMPFGYLAQGLLVVWMWYILQLFTRFHLTPRGIVWKDQRMFIGANSILLIMTLFFIRWI
jgi:hypothetical protein